MIDPRKVDVEPRALPPVGQVKVGVVDRVQAGHVLDLGLAELLSQAQLVPEEFDDVGALEGKLLGVGRPQVLRVVQEGGHPLPRFGRDAV